MSRLGGGGAHLFEGFQALQRIQPVDPQQVAIGRMFFDAKLEFLWQNYFVRTKFYLFTTKFFFAKIARKKHSSSLKSSAPGRESLGSSTCQMFFFENYDDKCDQINLNNFYFQRVGGQWCRWCPGESEASASHTFSKPVATILGKIRIDQRIWQLITFDHKLQHKKLPTQKVAADHICNCYTQRCHEWTKKVFSQIHVKLANASTLITKFMFLSVHFWRRRFLSCLPWCTFGIRRRSTPSWPKW